MYFVFPFARNGTDTTDIIEVNLTIVVDHGGIVNVTDPNVSRHHPTYSTCVVKMKLCFGIVWYVVLYYSLLGFRVALQVVSKLVEKGLCLLHWSNCIILVMFRCTWYGEDAAVFSSLVVQRKHLCSLCDV